MDQQLSLLKNKKPWEKKKTEILRIFELALQRLQTEGDLTTLEEDEISQKLSVHIEQVFGDIYPEAEDDPISYQGRCQPGPGALFQPVYALAQPDFQWGYRDLQENSKKVFEVECKRLGNPTSPSWKLNENYVEKGIKRFIPPGQYGQRAPSGTMIGYIQSMKLERILAEVNAKAAKETIPQLILTEDGWKPQGISKLEHQLPRPFPISPFTLHHFWVDLRRSPPSLQSATPSNSTEIEKTTPES